MYKWLLFSKIRYIKTDQGDQVRRSNKITKIHLIYKIIFYIYSSFYFQKLGDHVRRSNKNTKY